jgi:toxin ParE1/3/4
MRVVMHREARAELRAASSWYGDVSEELQVRFDRHIIATIERVAENPQHFPVVAADRFRRAVVDVFPYVLYFEVLPGRIKILAAAHGKRKPLYWLNRI